MRGYLFELLVYPYLMGMLLFAFHFFSRDLITSSRLAIQVEGNSSLAIDDSNLRLLNCTPDHVVGDCLLPVQGGYGVRRLAIVNGRVKELIYSAPE